MMTRKHIIPTLLLLSSCANPTTVPSIVPATPEDIAAESARYSAVPLSAQAYLTTGWSINTARCAAYFNALTVQADQNIQTQRGLMLLGAAGAAGVAMAGGPAAAVAAIPLATTLATGLASNQQNDLGGAPPVPTFGLVQSARNMFQLNSPLPPSLPPDEAKAYADRLIQEDATYCLPVGAQLLSSQAIMTAQPAVISPSVLTASSTLDAQPETEIRPPRALRHHIPHISRPSRIQPSESHNFFDRHPPSFNLNTQGNPTPIPPHIGVVR